MLISPLSVSWRRGPCTCQGGRIKAFHNDLSCFMYCSSEKYGNTTFKKSVTLLDHFNITATICHFSESALCAYRESFRNLLSVHATK